MLHDTLKHHADTTMVVDVFSLLPQPEHIVLNVRLGRDGREPQSLLQNGVALLREVSDRFFASLHVVEHLQLEVGVRHGELGRYLIREKVSINDIEITFFMREKYFLKIFFTDIKNTQQFA